MESCYSARYLAEKLLLNHFGDGTDRIGQTLFNAKISLNPHQIQAALFAFSSPVSKGVMLCDEVGLGKTIEAGIVISQYWCERKRNIVVIAPASLTRQWAAELEEKFNIPSIVVDRKYYNYQIKHGNIKPFEGKTKVIIMSLNFASLMADELKISKINLVVIDEAHKLRNVFNPNNVMSNRIKFAIEPFKKILLTATPLQNNLMELYGLSMLIDDSYFGDKEYYRKHYIKDYDENKIELRDRLSGFIHRTLRKQVQKYVKYSKRITETFKFTPSKEEDMLYDSLTELIQSNPTFGVKNGQNWLISMILRKLLSSSTAAVINTLENIKARLENLLAGKDAGKLVDILDEDDDVELDEFSDEENEELDISKVQDELDKVRQCLVLAYSIKDDKKAFRLLEAIEFLFSKVGTKREKKILIFTESRKTQDYLFKFLNEHGYSNTVLFNGGNSDPKTQDIYNEWISKPENASALHNSKGTNIRSAILDYFKNTADIMIATEAGAEGLNIQFCSMMINYDLPWNPQRVEQRIGRCHRFGQKNDVLVINFLNEHNQIDARVYELLGLKFKLFDDVFGSSDEVLGKLDSEANFEREIFNIYASCRTPEEIDRAFDELQDKFKVDISNEMKKTRELLIDNFDEDLQKIFDSIMQDTELKLKEIESDFLRICKYALNNNATFTTNGFKLNNKVFTLYPGNYVIASNNKDEVNLRLDDSNGRQLIDFCEKCKLDGSLQFDITNYPYQIKEIKNMVGKKGVISFGKIKIESFENEEYLILSGLTENGDYLNKETCEKLFRLSTMTINTLSVSERCLLMNKANYKTQKEAVINESLNRNNTILQEEINKIDAWANDKISGIQLKVELLREQRKELQKQADYCTNASEKVSLENEINKISKTIKRLWLELADSEDEVETKRKDIISKLKAESMKKITDNIIFEVEFEVI